MNKRRKYLKALVIEKKDLIHNIKAIKELAKKNGKNESGKEYQIIAVVKGNGYGLGLIEYSKILINQGINFLAVSTVEEAIALREAGIEVDILLLSSICIEEEVKMLIDNDIILSIGSLQAAEVANKLAKEKKVRAHIKIDTGFGRYGFVYTQINEIVEAYKNYPNLIIEGTFSHFSQSYAKNEKYTKLQFDRFISVIETLKLNDINPGMLHICNSSAFLKYPYMHLNAARIGSAFLGRILVPNKIGLKRIAKLETQIIEIKTLPKGYNIGYSCTEKTKKETKIAVLPVGYYDGFNVSTSNDMFRIIDRIRDVYGALKRVLKKGKITVVVGEARCKVLGQIGMHHTIIDITGANANIGDKVTMDVKPIYVQGAIRREYH